MEGIQAILFDFDDTLGNRAHYAYALYEDFLGRTFPKECEDVFLKEAMLQNMMIWDQRGDTKKDTILIRLQEKYRLAIPPIDFHAYFQQNIGKYSTLFSSSLAVLQTLKTRYRIGLLTNGEAVGQQKKVAHAIDPAIFDAVIISGATPYCKPQKEIFELAVKRLDCLPCQALMVGDNFANDIYGAIRAGLHAVWLCPDRNQPCRANVRRIRTIEELPALLD